MNETKTLNIRNRNTRQAYLLFFFTFFRLLQPSLVLQQMYLFRRRNFQILLNTHSNAFSFSQQQLPLLGFDAFKGDETRHMLSLKTHIKIKKKHDVPWENEILKKSWPAKIKRGSISQTWKPDCYIVCSGLLFAKEDFKRDLQVYEYWSW